LEVMAGVAVDQNRGVLPRRRPFSDYVRDVQV
jgi:hypothetical protein